MKKILFLTIALLGAGMAQAKSPVETYGALSTKGGKLVDSAGKAVTLRGMSLFWHMHLGGLEFWRASVVKNVLTDWHASVLRAPIGVETSSSNGYTQKGYLDDPTNALTMARQVVDAAIEYGIYVIIDYHAHYATQNVEKAKEFFKTLSEEYGNTPNIIWEIYNEPVSDGWSQIVGYANQVIPVIRKNSRNVILVPTSFYCQNLTEVDNQLDSKYSNLAYVLHFYAGSHSFKDRLGTTMGNGHAVFVSEWGTTDASGNGGYSQSSSESWLAEMDRLGISGCNWSLGNPEKNGVVETSAALEKGASQMGPWALSEITTSGEFVRSYLIKMNTAWTVSDTTTRILTPLSVSPALPKLGVDTVVVTGGFNKAVKSWILTFKGRTSGATFTKSGANTATISAKWRPYFERNLGSKPFVAGETIDISLTPLSAKASVTLDPTPVSIQGGALRRLSNVSWVGTELAVSYPGFATQNGSLSIRDMSGREVWNTHVAFDAEGRASATTPSLHGVHVIALRAAGETIFSIHAPGL